MPHKFGCDIDSVLCDFEQPFRRSRACPKRLARAILDIVGGLMRNALLATALVVVLAMPGGTTSLPLSLDVNPRFAFEPAKVEFRIAVEPHRDNVRLCFGFASSDAAVHWRYSCQQWNGVYAPRFHYQTYVLSAGHYTAVADLYRAPDHRVSRVTADFAIQERAK